MGSPGSAPGSGSLAVTPLVGVWGPSPMLVLSLIAPIIFRSMAAPIISSSSSSSRTCSYTDAAETPGAVTVCQRSWPNENAGEMFDPFEL